MPRSRRSEATSAPRQCPLARRGRVGHGRGGCGNVPVPSGSLGYPPDRGSRHRRGCQRPALPGHRPGLSGLPPRVTGRVSAAWPPGSPAGSQDPPSGSPAGFAAAGDPVSGGGDPRWCGPGSGGRGRAALGAEAVRAFLEVVAGSPSAESARTGGPSSPGCWQGRPPRPHHIGQRRPPAPRPAARPTRGPEHSASSAPISRGSRLRRVMPSLSHLQPTPTHRRATDPTRPICAGLGHGPALSCTDPGST